MTLIKITPNTILKNILFIFRERGMEGEREGEKHQCVVASCVCPQLGTWPATQACTLTGNKTRDPLVPRLALNPLSHISQGAPNTIYSYETQRNKQ